MDFGTIVEFETVVRPRYLVMRTPQRQVPSASGFWNTLEDVPGASPVLAYASKSQYDTGEPLGEPVPGAPDVPEYGEHRRLRRFPAGKTRGVIVGRTWRAEGEYCHGDHEQPPYLIERRRVILYEVAVRSSNAAMYPSEILMVHPDDIRIPDDVHEQATTG